MNCSKCNHPGVTEETRRRTLRCADLRDKKPKRRNKMPDLQTTTTGQPQVGTTDLLAVGDIAELTFCRSSQGHIELEMRSNLGAVKVRFDDDSFARLMFGQAHVGATVVRHFPSRRPMAPANDKAEALSLSEVDPPAAG